MKPAFGGKINNLGAEERGDQRDDINNHQALIPPRDARPVENAHEDSGQHQPAVSGGLSGQVHRETTTATHPRNRATVILRTKNRAPMAMAQPTRVRASWNEDTTLQRIVKKQKRKIT